MEYLYHMMPDNMKGNFLMPLNTLKKEHPSLYKEEVKKYEGRKFLLKVKIPYLNCLWNDVIHMTSINPKDHKKALVEAGMRKNIKTKWFRINPKDLDKDSTIVWLYPEKKGRKLDKKEYVKFNHSRLKKYSKVPVKTKKYFKETLDKWQRPFWFHLIPHILYKGKINIKNCKIIEV